MAILYHHALSAASRFARVLLVEKAIPFELRLEKEWERRPAFLRLNPAGEVPLFLTDDGVALSGTMAMAEYLEENFPEPALLYGDTLDRYEIRRLTGWFHTKIGSEVTRPFFQEKILKRYFEMGEISSQTIRSASHNLRIHLKYIEYLTGERNYLAGNRFSMADAAAAAHLSVVDYLGHMIWEDWPQVKDWYVRVKSRRSIRSLLDDRIAGLAPPAHYSELDF